MPDASDSAGAEPRRILELLPDVYLLRGIGGCNIYYLADPENPTLVDAGLPINAGRLVRTLRRLPHNLPPPTRVLITHYHIDHAGGAQAVRRSLGAAIVTHRAEVEAFVHRRLKDGALPWRVRPYTSRTEPDATVEDGDVLPILGGLAVVHTPGHTPGSLCFCLRERGVLFTGDLFVSYQDRLSRPFMGLEADRGAYAASLARMVELQPEALLPGHGYPVLDGAVQMLAEMAARKGKALGWRARARNVPRFVRFSLGMWRDLDYPRPPGQ